MSDYDALIVFGYGPVLPGPRGCGKLAFNARLNALAAGMLYRRYAIGKIIPTGAATGGEALPSEAALIADFIKRRFNVPPDVFILEERALSTLMNVALTANIIDRAGYREPALSAIDLHLPRIETICRIFCLDAASFAAEDVVCGRSRRHAALLTDRPQAATRALEANRMRGLHELPGYVLPAVGLVDDMARVRRILRGAAPHIQAYMQEHAIDPDAIDDGPLRAWLKAIPYQHPTSLS